MNRRIIAVVLTLSICFCLLPCSGIAAVDEATLQTRAADLAGFSEIAYSAGDAFMLQAGNVNLVTHLNTLENAGWKQIRKMQTAESMAVVSLDPQSIPGELHIKDSGLDVHSYINERTKEVVLAFAGTDSSVDGTADAQNHLGIMPQQYQDALAYAIFLKKKYGNEYTITLTGHSLGGAEATFVASVLNLPAVVFNPDYLGPWVEQYQANFSSPPIVQYVRKGELASAGSDLQNRLGGNLKNYFTKQIPLDYPVPWTDRNPVNQAARVHSITAMREYLESTPPSDYPQDGHSTVAGGCFGSLPLTDGRPSSFLDLIGQAVEGAGGLFQEGLGVESEGLGVESEALGVIETVVDLAGKIKLTLPSNIVDLGEKAGPLGKVLDILSVGGKLAEVGANCSIALASGSEQAFVDAINDGAKFAVSFLTSKLGELGGSALVGAGGTAVGGPIGTILGSFVGGWLGGKAGEMAGEWAYDTFLEDWVTKNIAEKLFDLLCPNKQVGIVPPVPVLPPSTPSTPGSGGQNTGTGGGSGDSSSGVRLPGVPSVGGDPGKASGGQTGGKDPVDWYKRKNESFGR